MPETQHRIAVDELHKIVEWTSAWYEQARAANFVSYPYQADNAVVARLRQYYRAGLTPAQAVEAYFGLALATLIPLKCACSGRR
ncbi:hypothetical protein [Trinickia sp. EG282A]|uniref:hypothetical protein n=1 Tax=Trinickia sp. EG282A TaxID=3237013 RepID=UPI0034D3280C